MHIGRFVFAQLMDHLPRCEFQKCVARYRGNYKFRGFSYHDQFLCLAFAQLTFRESLRDIEACLRAVESKLYHLGFRGRISRSMLADANEAHDWRIYADFAQVLLALARPLYANEPLGFDLDNTVYVLDSTTIDLCLSVFPWARFRARKAAIKMHTLLDLRGPIPTFIDVSEGKLHDVSILDMLVPEPASFYVMDRAYVDFQRLHTFHRGGAFFVTRTKRGVRLRHRYSRPVDASTGVRSDHTVVLDSSASRDHYPDPLRRLRVHDAEQDRKLIFVTNNFDLPALTICLLYKSRRRVGVSRQGHIVQSVKDRPGLKNSGPVAGEAPWRESKTAEPSDNIPRKECAQRTRLQRAVNADVASLHESPVAETVYNVRKQQGLAEMSPIRQLSPAGYQRRHGVKEDVETGETLGARRRNLVGEMPAITVSGKCRHRHQGGGSARSTVDGRAAKRARREGPGPVSIPYAKARQG
jgi:hypothetical protein